MFKFLLYLCAIAFGVCHATNCPSLPTPQLPSLAAFNERMSQVLSTLYSSPVLSGCAKAKTANVTPSLPTAAISSISENPSAFPMISGILASPTPFFPYAGAPVLPYPNSPSNHQVMMMTSSLPVSPFSAFSLTGALNSNAIPNNEIPKIMIPQGNFQSFQSMSHAQPMQVPIVPPIKTIPYENQFTNMAFPQQFRPQTTENYPSQNMSPVQVQYNPQDKSTQQSYVGSCSLSNNQGKSAQSPAPIVVKAQPIYPENPYHAPPTASGSNQAVVNYHTPQNIPSPVHHQTPGIVSACPLEGYQSSPPQNNLVYPATNSLSVPYAGEPAINNPSISYNIQPLTNNPSVSYAGEPATNNPSVSYNRQPVINNPSVSYAGEPAINNPSVSYNRQLVTNNPSISYAGETAVNNPYISYVRQPVTNNPSVSYAGTSAAYSSLQEAPATTSYYSDN